MELSILIPALCSSVLGGFVQAVCGFGFGPVNMSVLPYLFPYANAVALSGLCGSASATLVAFSGVKHANFRILSACAPMGVIFGAAAARWSALGSGSILTPCLGVALTALGVYSLFFSGRLRIEPTRRNAALAGAVAGVFGGLFTVGGAPMSLFMISAVQDKDEYRSTLNFHFCATSLATTVTRWYSGAITPLVLKYFLCLVFAMALGAWMGNRVFRRLNPQLLRRIIYGYLILAGVMMLFRQ